MPTSGARRTWLAAILLLAAAAGCELPSSAVAWAPDGRHGIYTVRRPEPRRDGHASPAAELAADAYVIDGDGRVAAKLGPVNNSFGLWGLTDVAWTADSASAYLATADPAADGEPRVAFDMDPDHLSPDGDRQPPLPPPPATRPAVGGSVLCRWDGIDLTPAVRVPGRVLIAVRPSPDGRWVAMLAATADERIELLAYDVGGRQLDRVRWSAGLAMCFTGPHRLAFVAAAAADLKRPGHVTEVDLDAPPTAGESGPKLFAVLPEQTHWLAPAGDGADGLLVQAMPTAYPSTSAGRVGDTLYRWDRGSDQLTPIADHVFHTAASPDGRRLLCVTEAADDGSARAVVMDADGSHARPVVPADALRPVLLPAWHGDRWITVARPASPADAPRQTFDVADLSLDPAGAVAPAVLLSAGWDAAMRPWSEPTAKPTILGPSPPREAKAGR